MSGLGRRAARIFSVAIVAALVLSTVAIQPASGAITYDLVLDDDFTWSSGGNASWTTVLPSATAVDGVDYARSGVIGNGASTWLETSVTGPGTLTWWQAVDCEPGWDAVFLSFDGGDLSDYTMTGSVAWTKKTLDVPAGAHTMRWTYTKDTSVSMGYDAVWLDQVRFNETPVALTDGAHLAASETRLFPTGIAAGDQTGQSVAISDDTMASGAPWDDTGATDAGSVAIYKRIDGYWTQYQLLTASDEIASAHFGNSVTMDGDYLSVGAYSREKIYAYMDNGVQFAPLGAPIPAPASNIAFGGAIAQSGTTLVAGCRAYGGYAGRVYVYVYDGGWVLQQAIDAPDGGMNQEFGSSVQIDGDRLIVGAPSHDHPGAPGGAAYVFDRSGSTWSLTTELTDPDGQDGDKLGSAVAVSGDTAVVGEPIKFKADVFTVEDGWHLTDVLVPPTKQTLSNFGLHVAIDGDTILAGDGFYDGSSKGGAVFAYQRSNGLFFDRVETIQPAEGESFPQFGDALDIDGAQFAVGARNFDGAVGGSQGASYVYDGAYYRVAEGGSLSIPAERGLLANDIDTAADILNVWVASGTTSGTMTTYPSGQFTYDALADSPAEVPFTYKATDGIVGSNEATGYITVAPSPSGTVTFNHGEDHTSSTEVDLNAALSNVRQYRTKVDGGAWGAWTRFSAASITVTLPAEKGDHTVTLEVRGSGGSSTYSETITLDTVVEAFSGSNRYETTVLASKAAYPSGADAVVIATGANWPDALGGASLAGALDGPILLTAPTSLPATVAAEITRLGATKAVIVGGTSAVSTVVENTLKTQLGAGNVERIAGNTRYETANAVAARVIELAGPGFAGDAFIATGANFPDSLAASPIAVAEKRPLYLVPATATGVPALPAAVTRVAILGSTNAVNLNVENSLKTKLGEANVVRLGGTTRYETAAAIATYGVDQVGLSWDGVAIATGVNFPDALGGGVLQGKSGSVMLLTDPNMLSVPTQTAITANKAAINVLRYFGSTSAVSQAVRNAIATLLQ